MSSKGLPDSTQPHSSIQSTSGSPTSSFDASIPFNLPPRRSMKMLKDGSDFVWPESAHSLFVRGLQAWKYMNIGNKRTRAPRGEGKSDFLVRYLESHGVERTKKQVASHLQVLRTEWRNSENTLLLSLVDDTVPHTRSLSEPSLPAPSTSSDSHSHSHTPYYNPSPELRDDRSFSTPALPSPIPAFSPSPSSSFHDVGHSIRASQSLTGSVNVLHTQSNVDVPWHTEDPLWNPPTVPSSNYNREMGHYSAPSYHPLSSNYRHAPGDVFPSALGLSDTRSDYSTMPQRRDNSSSGATAQHLQGVRHATGARVGGDDMSYRIYTTPAYPSSEDAAQQYVTYDPNIAYAAENYPDYVGSSTAYTVPSHSDTAKVVSLDAGQGHTQWVHPPGTTAYPAPPGRQGRSDRPHQ